MSEMRNECNELNRGTGSTPSYLAARATICADLCKAGRITRVECFRAEVDQMCGINTGPIEFEINTDHEWMMENSEVYRQRMSNEVVLGGCFFPSLQPPCYVVINFK